MNNPTINIQEYTAEYQSQVIRLILQIQQQEYQISITREDQPDLLEIETFYQKESGTSGSRLPMMKWWVRSLCWILERSKLRSGRCL